MRNRVSRENYLRGVLTLVTAVLFAVGGAAFGNDENLSGEWQLFIDDYCVQECEAITRTLHQPEKHPENPILKGDVPWAINPYLYGTVIYDSDESIYKMWYMSYNHGMPLAERTPLLYATSADGIHWDHPNLGLFDFRGSKENNIILENYGYHDLYSPSVIKDPSDPDPVRLYKMIYWDYPQGTETYGDAGFCLAFSPDGIHWTRHATNPVLYALKKERSISDVMDVMYDTRAGNYVAYTKGWAEPWPLFRQIVRSESDDFVHWSEPEVVLSHAFDRSDPQSYGMPVSQYESVYIGLLRSYKKPGDETIDIQLAVSHDNRYWSRVMSPTPFLPLGPEGSWDSGMIFTAPPIVSNDRIMIYYGAWDCAHNAGPGNGAIGLATLRKDGFVSLDARKRAGTVTTVPLRKQSGALRVNMEANEGGWMNVEVLSLDGRVLPGYDKGECNTLRTGGIDCGVTWRTERELPAGEPVRLRFIYSEASLYSFHAGPMEVDSQGCPSAVLLEGE